MKRRNPVKALEASELLLARLRADRARLDTEIASLEERHEDDVVQFVLDNTKRLKLAQLPAGSILEALEQLAKSAGVDRPGFDPDGTSTEIAGAPQQGLIQAFVRLSRNASAVNRDALESAGLRWNGRSGGWSGRVTSEALDRLRDIFGDRVERPVDRQSSNAVPNDDANGSSVDVDVEAPPIASSDAPLVNVEGEAAPVAPVDERDKAETAVRPTQPVVPAARRLPTPSFGAQLPRRPSPT